MGAGDSATDSRRERAELDRQVFDLRALLKAGRAMHSALDVDDLGRMVVAMVRERIAADPVAVLLADESHRQLTVRTATGSATRLVGTTFAMDDGILWRLLLAGEPFSVLDLDGRPRFADVFERSRLADLGTTLWAPMVLSDKVIGLLALATSGTDTPPTAQDEEFLATLAEQAAVAFNTTQLYLRIHNARRDLDVSLHKLSMLYDITRALAAVQDLTRLMRLILERAIQSVDAERGSLMLYDERSDELSVRVVFGLHDPDIERRINEGEIACATFRRGEGVAGRVLETRSPIRVHDAESHPGFTPRPGSNVRSILCVPLVVDDEAIGVLNITNRRGDGGFRAEDEEIMVALANQAAIAIARTRLYEAAITDGLTHLFVRRFVLFRLHEEVKRARRYGTPLSVVMCDIDHFRDVNTTHLHAGGDAVLVAVAEALRGSIRGGVDVAARYGGEEFLLVLPQTAAADAARVAERVRATVASMDTDTGDGRTARVTMSFGVADLGPTETAEDLVKRADQALYDSKNAGRNKVTTATTDR